jgi:hypothetical protein
MAIHSTRTFLVCAVTTILIQIAHAQAPPTAALLDPLSLPARCRIHDNDSIKKLRKDLQDDLAHEDLHDGMQYFCIAERMKRLGDSRAEKFYEKEIQAAPNNPNYELYYADYLRNFRGAQTPLFPQAEEHYSKALAEINAIPGANSIVRSGNDTQSLVERGLIALHQQDGLPLAYWQPTSDSDKMPRRPFAFFATINRYQQSPSELDREADIRDYTSEALFAESSLRRNKTLTAEELERLIRDKKAFETLDRIRLRYKAWPSVDVYYIHRQTNNAQITYFDLRNIDENPFNPHNNFNELRQNDFAIKADKPFSLSRCFDVNLTIGFRFVQRWGLIEGAPAAHENIPQLDSKIALSKFAGPDKAHLEVTYTYQWIQPAVPNFQNRYRDFFGVTGTYQLFRPLGLFHRSSYRNRFTQRGWDFFAGFLRDNEAYFGPDAFPRRRDYFFGTSPRGLLWSRFDLALRATRFTSDVKGIGSQKNSQWRPDVTGLIRVVDEDSTQGIPGARQGMHLEFIHLVGEVVREDLAQTGLGVYENRKYGGGLDTAFYTTRSRTTFLASVRYDRERYFHLDRSADIFSASFSIGF